MLIPRDGDDELRKIAVVDERGRASGGSKTASPAVRTSVYYGQRMKMNDAKAQRNTT